MTNKDFQEKVSVKTNFEIKDVKSLSASLVECVLESVKAGDVLTIQSFGTFEPRVKARRKIYNPTTKEFIIVPQKNTMGFKMSPTLKERLNMEDQSYE